MKHKFSRLQPVGYALCALPVALLLTGQAVAATRFVSPQGSDDANGSGKTPFRTIARARDAARERNEPVTVILRGGVTSSLKHHYPDGESSLASSPQQVQSGKRPCRATAYNRHSGAILQAQGRCCNALHGSLIIITSFACLVAYSYLSFPQRK